MGAQPEGAVAWTSAALVAEARRRPQRPREVGGGDAFASGLHVGRGESVLEDGALVWGLRNGGVGHELTGELSVSLRGAEIPSGK